MSMFKSIYDFPNSIKFGIINFFLEELISYGAYRQVYSHPYDDSVVIKIEHARSHCNAQEWYFWNLVRNTKFAKWFAPCIAISDDGSVLVQKKTTKPTKRQYL